MTNQNAKIGEQKEEKEEYEFVPLGQKNVDTGMGLERMTAVLQGKDNVYETELFEPIINNIKYQISNCKSKSQISNIEEERAMRIIADHIKAATFILTEGLASSNIGRGYVLRRLIRRAVRYGKLLGIENNFTAEIAKTVLEIYQDVYLELLENQDFIFQELQKEEEKFGRTLESGFKEFNKIAARGSISGKEMFDLYQNYGFPIEITKELAKERGLVINDDSSSSSSSSSPSSSPSSFQEEMKKHQELSRTASVGQFKSGLADNSEQTTKYHTATHLLLAALKQVLGNDVQQKGSNITSERLRFDFSFFRKITAEEIKKVENLVNQRIKDNLLVVGEEMETEKAKQQGAVGVFGNKYGDRVKVYTIGDFSKEICAGPHIKNTSELGELRIIKEEAVSAGVRRLKAILL